MEISSYTLKNLTRKELQYLAKKKGIKANLSSKKIHECLVKKTSDCEKSNKVKSNKTRKELQSLAKEKGIKANLSNKKIDDCLKKPTSDCMKKTRKQAPKKAKIPQISTMNILHNLAYIPNKYDYYRNNGANVAKTDEQIEAMDEEQYFDEVKSFYENKKTLRAEIWPKSMNEKNKVISQVLASKLIEHILSLCKNQPNDEVNISFRKFDQDAEIYMEENNYSFRCNDHENIKSALQTIFGKLQTFPFGDIDEFNDYIEYPPREEMGIVNVQVTFTTDRV